VYLSLNLDASLFLIEGREGASVALREQKRMQTRDSLFEAAVVMFVERGYHATTMDEIAERAVVSRATAFKYFPKKEDLLIEWAARRRQAAFEQVKSAEGARGQPAELKQAILGLAAWYTQEKTGRPFVLAWLTEGGSFHPEAWDSSQALAGLVSTGQTNGVIRPDVDAQVAGRLLLNVFLGSLYQWATQNRTGPWLRRELDAALGVVVDGLAATGVTSG
jgi:AcrR family transcriptional regulator